MVDSSFTSQGMIAAGKKFSEGVVNINGYKNTLQREMENLKARWGGEASRTFDRVMGEWNVEHAKIINQLQDIANTLGTGGNLTADTEQQASGDASFFKG